MLLQIVLYLTFSSCIILCSCIPRISILWYYKLYFNYIFVCSSLIFLTFIIEMIISCLHFNSLAIAPTRFSGFTIPFEFGVDPSYFLEIFSVGGMVLLGTLTLELLVVVVMLVFLLLDTVMGATTITVCFISKLHSLVLFLKKHYYKAAEIFGVRVNFSYTPHSLAWYR